MPQITLDALIPAHRTSKKSMVESMGRIEGSSREVIGVGEYEATGVSVG